VEVGGEGGQLRLGRGRERLPHPLVEFVLGQHALYECGLEKADHLFAVGTSRPCHHGASPVSVMQRSVNPFRSAGYTCDG
jgi:hypothetical protein